MHIHEDGSVTEVQFNNSAYEKSESDLVQEKNVDFKDLKNFWESKN